MPTIARCVARKLKYLHLPPHELFPVQAKIVSAEVLVFVRATAPSVKGSRQMLEDASPTGCRNVFSLSVWMNT